MTELTFTIEPQGAIRKVLEAIGAEMRGKALQNAVEAAALLVENAAKENVTTGGSSGLHVRTGQLRRSITHELVSADDSSAVYAIGTNIVYGPIHEYGGIVRAVNGPYLTFKTADGQWVRTRQVSIPARPYLRPAFDAQAPKLADVVEDVLARAVARAVGAL